MGKGRLGLPLLRPAFGRAVSGPDPSVRTMLPGGTRLAFGASNSNGSGIFSMKADGSELKRLTHSPR